MANNKNKKPTSIYTMALLIVALLIAGALIYLWVKGFAPASEASTRPFVDYTNTMHFQDREDTLVLGALNPTIVRNMQRDPNLDGDPILRTEKQIKEIQQIIKQAEDLVATATGTSTSISDPLTDKPAPESGNGFTIMDPIDDELPIIDTVQPIDDFIVDDDKDLPVVDDNEDINKEIIEAEPTPAEPKKTWLQKTGDSVKSFFGRAADTVKGWFGIKKQTSPITQKASLESFKVENLDIGGAKLTIKGKNLKINDEKNMAPEKGSKLTVFFEDFSNMVFEDTEFLVADNEIIVYHSKHFEELTQVYFESPTLGLKSTSNNTTVQPTQPKQTAPATGGEPEIESTRPTATLGSFRAENLSIGGAKIVITGTNLKINNLKNLAPEKGSRLTVFFEDFENQEFKDTEFLVANSSITAYSSTPFKKVTQVYFESPTLGIKSTSSGTSTTQAPVNKPKITGYKIENYTIYDQLVLSGENLLISSNRSDNDEQIVIMLRDGNSNTYSSTQFYGTKDKIYIIGDVDEFSNIGTIYFESKARGVTSTTTQLSIASIVNSLIGKAFAATSDGISSSDRINSRRDAYDELERQIENTSELVSNNYGNIIKWIIDNKVSELEILSKFNSSQTREFERYSEESGNSSLIGFMENQVNQRLNTTDQATGRSLYHEDEAGTWQLYFENYIRKYNGSTLDNYSPRKVENKLNQAKRTLGILKNNDLVLKILDKADEYQSTNTFPVDFAVRYSSNGAIFAELYGMDSEIKSAIAQITNDKTMLRALTQIGRPSSAYNTPKWIREAEKTAQNASSSQIQPALPTINQQVTF